MVNPSTAKALADRSLKAARTFDFWRKHLIKEMVSQSVPGHAEGKEAPDTMLLKREDVRIMVQNFQELKDELEKFASKLK